MKIIIVFLSFIGLASANSLALIDDGIKAVKSGERLVELDNLNLIAKAGKLNNVTKKSLQLSKTENIQSLIKLAIKENRTNFTEQFRHIKKFNSLKKGDQLLLICLKNTECNLNKFNDLMSQSPLHIQIATKYPNMGLAQINIQIGSLNENIMNKYFQSTGWNKIEGEIGRNGIDGLFIKKKKGVILDVMIVESKYNRSGLQHTKNGQQMSQQWVAKKIKNLQKQYPENQHYKDIQHFVENRTYRSMLWNLKINNENLIISLKKTHDKAGKIITSNLQGRDKLKINFNGNQEISIKNPINDFHTQIVSWYQSEITKIK